jgi:hypothetical protein
MIKPNIIKNIFMSFVILNTNIGMLALAAESDLDNALKVFLDGYNIEAFLEAREKDMLEDGLYKVKTGDTLNNIVKKIFPNSYIKYNILEQAFVNANPRSFRAGNPNFLFADQTLMLPDEEHIAQIIFTERTRNDKPDRENWVRFP